MWIELPDEIEEYLCGIENAMDKSSLALNALFESMLKGQHIVFASRKLLKKIEELEYLNPSNKSFIRWIKQQYIYVYECKDIVHYKILVTANTKVITVSNNVYFVPLEYFYDFRESKLLTENEVDGECFIRIYNYIKKQRRTSSLFNIKFENDAGHGGNVTFKIKQSAKENRIALCILDSDREMMGAKTGSTFKGANNVFNVIKDNHIILVKALDSREIENLFPPNVYLLLYEEKNILLTILYQFIENEKIIKYFDVKDGVTYKKYKIKGWQEYYKDVIAELERAGIYQLPQDDRNDKEDFVCLEGIGDKKCDFICKILLDEENVCEELLGKHGMTEEKKNEVRNTRNNLMKILPPYLYKEWEQIYELMFSWGCCISINKLPNYQL